MKVFIVLALIGILGALASAGAFMLRRRQPPPGLGAAEPDRQPDRRMAHALAVRVALSVGLFLFILLGWVMGWVRPGGLPIGG
ncbi:MAG: DUF2909 domain-containing protein [Burkholderiales bacterium]|nr:DUF2909 domain-containing protein [Burkholderiales bacterium]